jgi:hypothetical protein
MLVLLRLSRNVLGALIHGRMVDRRSSARIGGVWRDRRRTQPQALRYRTGAHGGFQRRRLRIAITPFDTHSAESAATPGGRFFIPNGLLAEYTSEAKAERITATVCGTNLLMTLTLVSVVWRDAVHAQLVRPDMADEDMKTLTKRLTHVGRLRGDDHCGTVPTSSCRPRSLARSGSSSSTAPSAGHIVST